MIRRLCVLCALTFVACSEAPPPGTGGGSGGSGGGGSSSGGGTGGGGSDGSICKLGLADISADTTWSGDLTVDCHVIVRPAVTLTIAAGTHLLLGAGGFDVDGSLNIAGTTASPVTIGRAGAAPWGPILLRDSFGTRAFSIKHATLTGGGTAGAVETSTTLGAAIVQQVHDTPLSVEDLTIDGASGVGVVMESGPFAAGSSGLTVKNSGSYPMFVSFEHLGTIPAGTYATNPKAGILTGTAWRAPFADPTRITTDSTIRKLDVPYVVGTGAYTTKLVVSTVQGGPPTFASIPLVTIEAGVEFRFARVKGTSPSQSLLSVASGPDNGTWKPLGAIRAVGTTASPIVFTSDEATPAAGDWATISLSELDARTQFDHVVLGYAGANAGALGPCQTGSPTAGGNSPFDGDAAFQQFMTTGSPGHVSLTNSAVHDSAGGGVYRAFADVALDFTAGNTFTNIAWCRQTPVKVSGVCVPAMCI